ncbi:dihydrodipicolinate synthase family protein [Salinarimonas sp. NSM]|uniref:dihydrodipicolinate synthase family protein n=1 Tax=Salinarimonas sp. NSM TaxID=3458003 RepID=UPI0040366E3A
MLTGTTTALVTPFGPDGVDVPALRRLTRWQLDEGIDGLLVGSWVGEAPTLTPTERRTAIRAVVDETGGRVPVVAAVVANATSKAVALARDAAAEGADGLLVCVPFYNKPTQAGIVAHFEELFSATPLPVLVSVEPDRTALDLSDETVARLARNPTCAAFVHSSGDPSDIRRIVRSAGRVPVLAFQGGRSVENRLAGAVGSISVVANIAPRLRCEVERLCECGEFAAASAGEAPLNSLLEVLGSEPDPAALKSLLSKRMQVDPAVRLPLCPLDPAIADRIERALRKWRAAEKQRREASSCNDADSDPAIF